MCIQNCCQNHPCPLLPMIAVVLIAGWLTLFVIDILGTCGVMNIPAPVGIVLWCMTAIPPFLLTIIWRACPFRCV